MWRIVGNKPVLSPSREELSEFGIVVAFGNLL